jgi:hypothetical protein
MCDLLDVALDYEAGQVEMPDGNPWRFRRRLGFLGLTAITLFETGLLDMTVPQ